MELFKYLTFWGEPSPTRAVELYWSNPKSNPLFFCSFDPPCQLQLLSQSLFISRRLSHLSSPLLFFFCFFGFRLPPFPSKAPVGIHSTSVPAWWGLVISFPLPQLLYLPLASSRTLFLFFFSFLLALPEGERSKCVAGGTGQAVCLHLIIIVSHSPTGEHAALIADEMSHINVLGHMNNSKVTRS